MDPVVEFKEEDDKPMGGRRAKIEKEKKRKLKPGSFETLGLSQTMLRAIKRKGYQLPTPIQRRTLPLALSGQDVVGMARTGSGKTAAFVVPMLERLKEHSTKAGAQALILAPTRELVIQLHKAVKELARYTNLRLAVLVGGDSMEAQFAELAANPDIILATPGRLMHHLQEVEGMSLKSVQYCVFDEADQLFEMGFAEQLRAILTGMGDARQTLLFSATLPAALAEFARAGLRNPAFVRLDIDTKLSPDLGMCFACVRQEDKPGALLWLLQEVIPEGSPTLIFTATRHHVEYLHNLLTREGLKTVCVYGQMDQVARRIHSSKFRAGIARILIVTDVAARGIDLPFLDNVINYDFPAKPKLFIHRAGRAARAGRSGMAFSFFTRDELPYLLDLHLLLSSTLTPAPAVPQPQAADAPSSLSASNSVYGMVPQAPVEDAAERVRDIVAGASELQAQQRSCSNAWNLYKRTRPAASPESAARARTLAAPGPHPLLAAACTAYTQEDAQAQVKAANLRAKLRSYRPSATVLEAELAPASRGDGAGTLAGPGLMAFQGPSNVVEVMREKRSMHAKTIQLAKQQKADEQQDAERSAAPGLADGNAASAALRAAAGEAARVGDVGASQQRFRDPECFIPDQKASRYEEKDFAVNRDKDAMASAVLDLQQDDAAGMATQQRRFHWDSRKRRYIQMQPDEEVKAGKRRAKDGSAAKQHETGLYKKWMKHSKMRMPSAGEDADSAGPVDLSHRFKKGGRGWHNPLKAAPAARGTLSELRTPDQVRKQVKQKEKQKQQNRIPRSAGKISKKGKRSRS